MKIEDKIKQEAYSYDIKTSSSDILNQLNKNKKPAWYLKYRYAISFSLIAIIAVLIIIPTLFINKENNNGNNNSVYVENTSSKLNDTSLLSAMSFQLFYGGSMFDATNKSTSTKLGIAKVTTEDFNRAQAKYEEIYPIIQTMFNNKNGLYSCYESCDFIYENNEYSYYMQVAEFGIYLQADIMNTDKRIQALYFLNDQYYLGFIEASIENDEAEVEMSFTRGNQVIEIERDFEKEEFSIEYSIYENNKKIETYEIEIEYEDDELICDYEYENSKTALQIETKVIDNSYLISYVEEKERNISLEMIMTIVDGKHFYILN